MPSPSISINFYRKSAKEQFNINNNRNRKNEIGNKQFSVQTYCNLIRRVLTSGFFTVHVKPTMLSQFHSSLPPAGLDFINENFLRVEVRCPFHFLHDFILI